MISSFFSRLFGAAYWPVRWRSCAALLMLHGGVWAQEPAPTAGPSLSPAKTHEAKEAKEAKAEKPSAVVHKHYRCQGGKSLVVRYQLGARSVHAFAKLQGKMRELPWDGDYKLEHEDDERFSDGQYEMVVQGNFSRVTSVRRLPSKSAAKAGRKGRELLRACTLPKAQMQTQAQTQAQTAGRLEKKADKAAEKPKSDAAPAAQISPSPSPGANAAPAASHEAAQPNAP